MLREVPLVSVNAGAITLLGMRRGREVYSGIHKVPVLDTPDLHLGWEGLENLDGSRLDHQADDRVINGKRVHGGRLKALYMCPRGHYEQWAAELNAALLPGDFGENLTVDDVLEHEVFIGEQWLWGDAILEVTGPRRPCYKLNMLRGDGTSEAMMRNGRCGWYFKVLRTGKVPTSGSLHVVWQPKDGLTIAQAFSAKVKSDPTVPDMPDS